MLSQQSSESTCFVENWLESLALEFRDLDREFSGVGLVFCDERQLPQHIPLSPPLERAIEGDCSSFILDRSRWSHPFHDGFHLLSSRCHLLIPNAYLSPAIPTQRVSIEWGAGCRYVTALLSSLLPGVLKCATVTRQAGCLIYQDGESYRLYSGWDSTK